MNKKNKIVTLIGAISVFLTVAISLTLFVIVPGVKISNASAKIENGEYETALSVLDGNNSKKAKQLKAMCRAGVLFNEGDYEQGIEEIYQDGGQINVFYDTDGGYTAKEKEIIKKRHVDNVASKLGYTFSNWSLNSYSLNPKEFEADLHLKSVYDLVTYNIYYDLDGGTNDPLNPTEFTVETPEISLKPATKTGYVFCGWSIGDFIYSTIPTGTHEDVHLKAEWRIGRFSLTYMLDGGTITVGGKNQTASLVQRYNFEESITPPADPVKTGYSFVRWSPSIPKTMPADNVVCKAIWSKVVTLTFQADTYYGDPYCPDDTIDVFTLTGIEGSSLPPVSDPSRKASKFKGWNPSLPTTFPSENTTYHAIWEDIEYKITYDLDGGTFDDDSSVELTTSYTYVQSCGRLLPIPKASKPGCIFSRWSVENADIKEIKEGFTTSYYLWLDSSKSKYGDLTVKAVWSQVVLSVVVTCNSAKGSVSGTGNYVIGDEIKFIATPLEGYSFRGWFKGEYDSPLPELISEEPTFVTDYLTISTCGQRNFCAKFNSPSEDKIDKDMELGYFPSPYFDTQGRGSVGNELRFGVYPQTRVPETEVDLISRLDYSSELAVEKYNYYVLDGMYYAKLSKSGYPDRWYYVEPIWWRLTYSSNGWHSFMSEKALYACKREDYVEDLGASFCEQAFYFTELGEYAKHYGTSLPDAASRAFDLTTASTDKLSVIKHLYEPKDTDYCRDTSPGYYCTKTNGYVTKEYVSFAGYHAGVESNEYLEIGNYKNRQTWFAGHTLPIVPTITIVFNFELRYRPF